MVRDLAEYKVFYKLEDTMQLFVGSCMEEQLCKTLKVK